MKKSYFSHKIKIQEKQQNYKIAGIIAEKQGLFKKAIENYSKLPLESNYKIIKNIKNRILNINNNQKEILTNPKYLDTLVILEYYKEKGVIFPEGIINEISN